MDKLSGFYPNLAGSNPAEGAYANMVSTMRKRPKIEITEIASGKKISFKKLKKLNQEDKDGRLEQLISRSRLLSEQILTRSQIEKFIKDGWLHEIVFNNQVYFDRKEALNCARNILKDEK